MFEHYYQYNPIRLSSVCPHSCALVAFALRVGGTIDPEFLMQCEIMDPKFRQMVNGLKPIPLSFDPSYSNFDYQEDIFLDMSVQNARQFYDPLEFKQYNSWIGSDEQFDSTYGRSDDIIIDFM